MGRHHAGRRHRACGGGDDPGPTADRLGGGGVLVAPAPPQCPRSPVGTRRRCDGAAGRSRRGSLAGRLPRLGHRAGPPAIHPDGDRRRPGLHRRRRGHPAGRAIGHRALPGPRGRRRVGRLPGGQDRAREPRRALRTGGRAVPRARQPAHLDRAEGRPGTLAQVVAATRVRRRRPRPLPGGVDHPHRRSVGQQRNRCPAYPQLRRLRPRDRDQLRT